MFCTSGKSDVNPRILWVVFQLTALVYALLSDPGSRNPYHLYKRSSSPLKKSMDDAVSAEGDAMSVELSLLAVGNKAGWGAGDVEMRGGGNIETGGGELWWPM
jgi:hypothetical protein